MRILVVGSGKMGRAVAWDLAQVGDVDVIGLGDVDEKLLQQTGDWINSSKIELHPLDILDRKATVALMGRYDVVVSTLPTRPTSYGALEASIEAGTDYVDILEEYHRSPDTEETEGLKITAEYGERLHERALEKGVTVLDGMGFAPGLSNITVGEAIRKLDRAETVIARVGGVPSEETANRNPLRYMITWAFEHVLREYMVDVQIIEDGKVTIVPAMSAYETFGFTEFGLDVELEAAITPGMPSFIHTRPTLNYFAEKTIRWVGHYQAIQSLRDCGLLSLEPIEFEGQQIVPRQFFCEMITPRLLQKEGDTDVCFMYNTITGTLGGRDTIIEYRMADRADPNTGLSSMARVTGFSASISALLLGRGEISEKGIVAPEDAIKGDLYGFYIAELEKRRILVKETQRAL